MPHRPLISIVIPTYEREALLRDAVHSVFAQTYDRWELFIVDDGSTDGTRAYLDSLTDPRVHQVRLDHSGNAALARNQGIRRAKGSLVAFLDSDDLWQPQKLAVQLEEAERNPECRWSYTGLIVIDEQGREIQRVDARRAPTQRGCILERLIEGRAFVTTSTVLAERKLLEAVGGFDETLLRCHDIDLWIRLAEASPTGVVSVPLTTWRQHRGNRRAPSLKVFGFRTRIYERLLERTPSPRLRRLCRRRRRKVSLQYVGALRRAGQYHDARRALSMSFPYSWWHGGWWTASLKTLARPAMPAGLLSFYRRLTSRSARIAPGD